MRNGFQRISDAEWQKLSDKFKNVAEVFSPNFRKYLTFEVAEAIDKNSFVISELNRHLRTRRLNPLLTLNSGAI